MIIIPLFTIAIFLCALFFICQTDSFKQLIANPRKIRELRVQVSRLQQENRELRIKNTRMHTQLKAYELDLPWVKDIEKEENGSQE